MRDLCDAIKMDVLEDVLSGAPVSSPSIYHTSLSTVGHVVVNVGLDGRGDVN